MKQIILIAGVVLSLFQARAQQQDIITVRAGDNEGLMRSVYAFPAFKWGRVYFVSGDSSKARLNYHLFLEKMQYIGAQQDTLVLTNETSIRAIVFDDVIYTFKNTHWLSVTTSFGKLQLAERNSVRLLDEQKIGAFGLPSSTQSIENKSTFREHDARLLVGKNLVFRKERQLYFSETGAQFDVVSRRNILGVFHKYRKQIERYLNERAVDLKKEDQLKSLFAYIASLL